MAKKTFEELEESNKELMSANEQLAEHNQELKKQVSQYQHLEQVIAERTAMLQSVNESLKHSNKNLQEFVSIASHDLQEPLRKIKTFISILSDRHTMTLNAEGKSLLLKTTNAANRMSALITDVLSYSRITHPGDTFILTDLNLILDNVIQDFDLKIEEKKAVIKVENKLPLIEAVPIQINQLFYNLLSNALKFSNQNKPPEIIISNRMFSEQETLQHSNLAKDQSYCQLIFKDNGIGFHEQFNEQIFSIFERLNNPADFDGTGIGLALCRKIVINHHGLIYAEAKEAEGATFYIILPVAQIRH